MTIEIRPTAKAKSWSFSALSNYEQCAWKYYLERFEKIEQEPGFALVNGVQIHNKAEQYLLKNITGVPPELNKFKVEMENLLKHEALAEEEIVLDRHWMAVKGDNAWSSSDAWIRAKVDARVGDFVVDFKTGRAYDKYSEQADLYATLLSQKYLDIGDITVEFWYLKSGQVQTYEFAASEQQLRLELWDSRASKLMQEKEWKPKRNEYCKFCHVQEHCSFFNART